ncbi:hypothetical protein [Sphingomonas sp. M1-B02]|uniref:hypothetical protein n=1 Tax=Sphingomonas sp. M1-B02 TaxID=3114300 RepID=UPI00223F1679|nr:hypothetical protein [Sphingomonas sp. S6-11]UZK65878.1 hypothetical protein OKW87_15415 [Sphingomonas sp. S6-11]
MFGDHDLIEQALDQRIAARCALRAHRDRIDQHRSGTSGERATVIIRQMANI